jgi:hypothetical protein
MKIAIVLLYFLTFLNVTYSQEKNKLLGKWQAETSELTSMNFDTYQFSSDGKFIFNPNAYNGLNRIINISGQYQIKGDTLFLTPEYTKEITGGYPIRSESTTLSDTWEITGGQSKTLPCKKRVKQLTILKISSDNKTFLLDKRKFYKVD